MIIRIQNAKGTIRTRIQLTRLNKLQLLIKSELIISTNIEPYIHPENVSQMFVFIQSVKHIFISSTLNSVYNVQARIRYATRLNHVL